MLPEIVIHILKYISVSDDLINAFYAFLPVCRILKLNCISHNSFIEYLAPYSPFHHVYVSTVKKDSYCKLISENNIMETNPILCLNDNIIKVDVTDHIKIITVPNEYYVREIHLDYNTIYKYVITTKRIPLMHDELFVYTNNANIATYVHIKIKDRDDIFSDCIIELKKELSILDAFYITCLIFSDYTYYPDDDKLYGKCYTKNESNSKTTHRSVDFDPIYLVD